jgi:putative MATE family efflux protein
MRKIHTWVSIFSSPMSAIRPKADLTQGPIFKHIMRMAIPMMIGMTAHMVVNIVDGIYAGRLGTQESLAVLNFGFPFFYLFFAVLNGIGSGLSSNLARTIGAKKWDDAKNTLSQTIWFCLLAFAVFMLIYPWILPAYLRYQGATPEASILTKQYLNMLFLGLPFTIVATMLGSSLRAEGNTRTLMNAMMIGTLANVILAPFIIYSDFTFLGMQWHGLGLSVTGAGIATSSSGILSCLLIGLHIFRGKSLISFRWIPDMKDLVGFKDSLRVGFPSILSQTLIGLNLAIMTHLAKPFGESAVAAIGIASRLDILSVFPALAIMVAVVSLVGQNFGAGAYARVRETIRVGLISAFVFLAAIGILVFTFKAALIGFFKPEWATVPSASHYLTLLSFGYGFVGLSLVSSGAFQGMGRGTPFLFITLLRLILISFPLALILGHSFGEKGLHFAPPIASIVTGILASTWVLRVSSQLKPKPETTPAAHLSPAT